MLMGIKLLIYSTSTYTTDLTDSLNYDYYKKYIWFIYLPLTNLNRIIDTTTTIIKANETILESIVRKRWICSYILIIYKIF